MKTIICLLFFVSSGFSLFAQTDSSIKIISSDQDWRVIARNNNTNSWFYNPDKIWILSGTVFKCEIKYINHYPGEDPNTIAKNFYRIQFDYQKKTVKIISVEGKVPSILPEYVKQSIITNCYNETKKPFFDRNKKSPF